MTNVKLLVVVDEVDSILLKIIEKNNQYRMPFEDIIIYDNNDKLIYSDSTPKVESPKILDIIRKEKEYKYAKGDTQFVGIHYPYKEKNYIVIASAFDKFGLSKINNLKKLLIAGIFICIIIIFLSGWFYSGRFLKPISNVVQQVDKITFSNIDQRLNEGNKKDEIGQLAITFNRMLERLETAFKLQKKFVSNASHELRNPLTAISGQIDVALMKDRETEQYKNILSSVSVDIKNLRTLTNNLLELANSDVETLFQKFDELRIDEVLWTIRDEMLKQKPETIIHIDFEKIADNEKSFMIKGNEKLLKTAISNIIDNACKFSQNKTVEIKVTYDEQNIIIFFIDKGTGISETELTHIFEPFFRGSNAHGVAGNGIGLSLAQRIINIHSGNIFVTSAINTGTTVKVNLPNLS